MGNSVSSDRLAQLWDRYVEVSRQYRLVKQATDAAETACKASHDRCEAAYAEEIRCGQLVMQASEEFQAAASAVGLRWIGVSGAGLPFTSGRNNGR